MKTGSRPVIAIVIATLILLAGGWYWYAATGGFCANPITDRVTRDHLLQLWRQGRVTVLIRHTEKCMVNGVSQCPPGQVLTRQGEKDAATIGRGVTELLPGPFTLLTSKVDRTRETARIGFEHPRQIVPWLREDCKQELQQQLMQPPEGNRIMITHSTCLGVLQQADGSPLIDFDPAGSEDYGLVVFLEHPAKGGMPKVIGCLWPDDWEDLEDE